MSKAKPAAAPADPALKLHMPGDEGASEADEANRSATPNEDGQPAAHERDSSFDLAEEAVDDRDARIAQLEADNAQLQAMVDHLSEQLANVQEEPQVPVTPEPPRLVGEDWSSMTAAQAKARGCNKRVLCSDGYFVPPDA